MSSLELLLELAEELDNLKIQESQRNTLHAYPHLHYRHNHPGYHYHFVVPETKSTSPSRNVRNLLNRRNSDSSSSTIGKQGFQISMDVQQFLPNEITVKTIDNFIVIEGKHKEREDNHGLISRHFIRKYPIPEQYDPKLTVSHLSSDGILTVSVPKPKTIESTMNERIIQIQHTGPAHLSVKENPIEDEN